MLMGWWINSVVVEGWATFIQMSHWWSGSICHINWPSMNDLFLLILFLFKNTSKYSHQIQVGAQLSIGQTKASNCRPDCAHTINESFNFRLLWNGNYKKLTYTNRGALIEFIRAEWYIRPAQSVWWIIPSSTRCSHFPCVRFVLLLRCLAYFIIFCQRSAIDDLLLSPRNTFFTRKKMSLSSTNSGAEIGEMYN